LTDQPTLCTPRLELRPFTLDDAQVVQRLAGDRAIADTTANIPHPYEDGMAEAWISTHPALYEQKIDAVYAMTLADTGELVGAIGLMLNLDNQRGELGYWVGKPY
jgi:RimJ/RimL family protein N-acetyltransferase